MEQNTGILFIDKPINISSHGVVNRVRRLTGVKRVGHAGTLDPLATGLLIVLVGREFTKRQSEFLKQDKEYICTAELGVTTDTYDRKGEVTSQAEWSRLAVISREDIEKVLADFRGTITQTVPAFSAVKVGGEKLYDKARKGKALPEKMPSREITITTLELLSFEKNSFDQSAFFSLRVNSSSGTYIRSLVHDIGQKLGVGATVTELRRTKIGLLSLDQASTLKELVTMKKRGVSLPFSY